MQLLDFINEVDLLKKTEVNRAKYLCYYHYKEDSVSEFNMTLITHWMEEAGFCKPNVSRLKNNLTKGKSRSLLSSNNGSVLHFVPVVLQSLEMECGQLWVDTVTIVSNSELLEESKFCVGRHYLNRLVKQINSCYRNNCYDACAVLMRRLFEVTLILVYQNKGAEKDITNYDGSHFMLERIVKDAVQNKKLGIPARITKNFDSFREIGNLSAHGVTYTAGRLDIACIIRDYRVMLEDLFSRGGIV